MKWCLCEADCSFLNAYSTSRRLTVENKSWIRNEAVRAEQMKTRGRGVMRRKMRRRLKKKEEEEVGSVSALGPS